MRCRNKLLSAGKHSGRRLGQLHRVLAVVCIAAVILPSAVYIAFCYQGASDFEESAFQAENSYVGNMQDTYGNLSDLESARNYPVSSVDESLQADNVISADKLSAASAVLIEAETLAVLEAKDASARRPMASTTKIATAITAIELWDQRGNSLSDTVSVDKSAAGIEGSSIYLFAGERITMENLLYAMMLESANDAAAAIAIAVSGSIEAFAEEMNALAQRLGLNNTHFTNPHGLDNEQHYTTAYELARLTAYALENDIFAQIVSTPRRVIEVHGGDVSRVLVNHNRLLTKYDGTIGVKTGFTKRSGRCLVTAVNRDGITLIAVTLNAPSDWNDHCAMYDAGFGKYERIILGTPEEQRRVIPVVGGNAAVFSCGIPSEVSAVVKSEGLNIRQVIECRRFYYAPITEGDTVGYIVWYNGDDEIARAPLVSEQTVDRIKFGNSIAERIKGFFK